MQDFDRADLDDSMSAFEAATSADHMEIPEAPLRRLLVAIDGSNQDRTALPLARQFASLSQAEVYLIYAYFGVADAERDRVAAAGAIETSARVVERAGESSPAVQLLEAAHEHAVDLVIVCAPYLEDYHELGPSSLGTTVDVVLSRRQQPVLVVREPAEPGAVGWRNVILPVNLVTGPSPRAAAWAARLAAAGSVLDLLAVADTEIADNIRLALREKDRLDDIDEDRLAGLVRPETAGLIAALQRRASEHDFRCRVQVRSGPLVEAVTTFANAESALLVTTCTTDCASTGYQRVQAIVRGSRNPVLVV